MENESNIIKTRSVVKNSDRPQKIEDMTKNSSKDSKAMVSDSASKQMTLDDKLNKILSQLELTNQGVTDLNEKFDKMNTDFQNLKSKTEKNTTDILDINKKLDDLEQYSRRNNLRFFGIPESNNEDTAQLITQLLSTKLNISIKIEDIERTYRVGQIKQGNIRAILVKFVSYNIKAEVYKKKNNLKGTRITIREDITAERMKILNLVLGKYERKNVWTQDGRIKWFINGKTHTAITMDQYDAHLENI